MVLMSALAAASAVAAYYVLHFKRGLDLSACSLMAGMLFALIPLRNAVPGDPPIGSIIDFGSFIADALTIARLADLLHRHRPPAAAHDRRRGRGLGRGSRPGLGRGLGRRDRHQGRDFVPDHSPDVDFGALESGYEPRGRPDPIRRQLYRRVGLPGLADAVGNVW